VATKAQNEWFFHKLKADPEQYADYLRRARERRRAYHARVGDDVINARARAKAEERGHWPKVKRRTPEWKASQKKLKKIQKAKKAEANRRLIRNLKRHPCRDCRRLWPYYVMQFDHREGEVKCFEISNKGLKCAPARLLAEIAKCDLACGNCHAIRTHKRRLALVAREMWEQGVGV